MGFGGAAGMITSLKNNSRRKTPATSFKGTTSKNKKGSGIPSKPISEEALEEIKARVIAEEKVVLKRSIIVFSIVMTCVISLFIFFVFLSRY